MCSSASPTGGTIANVSIAGPSSRSGAISARPSASLPRNAASTTANDWPRSELGQLGHGRELEHAADRRDLVGHARQPLVPRVQDLARALEREEQDAGVDLVDRVQLELDRRHDAEVAAAAAERPEELGLVLGVDAAQLAVGGHELDRGDAVRGEAVLARVPADAAAERVADDAHVRRGAVQRGEPELGGARHDVLPLRARARRARGGSRRRSDALQLVGLQQDRCR